MIIVRQTTPPRVLVISRQPVPRRTVVFVRQRQGRDGAPGQPAKLCVATRGEAISGARAVYLVEESGVVKCYRASSAGQAAHGFVIEAGSENATVDVWRVAPLTALSGIVTGQTYWLGSAGQFVTSPPSGASIIQRLGLGVSATDIAGNVQTPVTVSPAV